MTDEDDLRRMLGATGTPPNTLDARRIVAKSRARRLPRQLAAGAASALVIAGVSVLAVQTTQYSAPSLSQGVTAEQDTAPDAGPVAPEAMDTMLKRIPADRVNLCAAPLAEVAGSQYGLQLDVVPPAAVPTGTAPVAVMVTLTNTSDALVVGTTSSLPAITLSQGGIVQWHTNGPSDSTYVALNLAPGASVDYTTTFTPVRCDTVDDEGESFRSDLPALEAGDYELSALLDFAPDASMLSPTTELDLVAGPRRAVTLG